ncbi:MAG: T9SS type A sorting domain-containing protein [Salibacteraceae bacterium]
MKKLLLSIFLLSCIGLQAQNFSAEVSDTTLYGSHTESTFFGDIDLFNDAGSAFNISWERVEESIPTGWTTSNCDPEICHPEGVTSASFDLPTLGGYLNTHFYPHGVAGTGYIKIKLWNTSDPSENIELTYHGVAGAVGINELSAPDIQVFPTVVNTSLTVMLPNSGETINVHIYDLSGQRMRTFQMTTDNMNHVDVSDLSAGMYLLNFEIAGAGRITKMFV